MTHDPKPTRRLFAGLVVAAPAMVAAPALAAPAPVDADAGLVRLVRHWQGVRAAYDAAFDRRTDIMSAVGLLPPPDALRYHGGIAAQSRTNDFAIGLPSGWRGQTHYRQGDLRAVRQAARNARRIANHNVAAYPDGRYQSEALRCEEVRSALIDHQRARLAEMRRLGHPAAKADTGRIGAELDAVEVEILATKATTLAGLSAKGRVIARYYEKPSPDEADTYELVLCSMLEDLGVVLS